MRFTCSAECLPSGIHLLISYWDSGGLLTPGCRPVRWVSPAHTGCGHPDFPHRPRVGESFPTWGSDWECAIFWGLVLGMCSWGTSLVCGARSVHCKSVYTQRQHTPLGSVIPCPREPFAFCPAFTLNSLLKIFRYLFLFFYSWHHWKSGKFCILFSQLLPQVGLS